MIKTDIEFTKAWWLRCLNDDAKMTAWLQKLQRTELSGYTDHIDYMAANPELTIRQQNILTNIANDELKHSWLLIDLFTDRKIEVVPVGANSTYWDDVLADVTSFEEYCAANYYGEALAADRFDVILSMKETPDDIRHVLNIALPDEIFHRETLKRLAGEEALLKYDAIHSAALTRLVGA